MDFYSSLPVISVRLLLLKTLRVGLRGDPKDMRMKKVIVCFDGSSLHEKISDNMLEWALF
jgi:hypothetical protein